jgi:hypothetical protein
MKIKTDLLLTFLFGGSLILFIIWNRLIRVRLPKDIQNIGFTSETYIVFVLGLFFILLTLFYFIKIMKSASGKNPLLYNRYFVKFFNYLNTKYLFRQLCISFTKHILEGPQNIYEFCYQRVYLKPFIEYIGGKFHDSLFNNNFRLTLVNICMFILPKMLVVLAFSIEVIFYNKLNYFYKLLIVLIIPLIMHILVYIIQHHAKKALDYYEYYFEFSGDFSSEKLVITYRTLTDAEDIAEQTKFDPETLMIWWEFYQYIYNITCQIKLRFDNTKNYVNFVYYSIYAIGFMFYFFTLIGFY